MNKLIDNLNRDNINISVFFLICMSLRKSFLDFILTFPNILISNIDVKMLMDEINFIFDKNLTSVLKHYSSSRYEREELGDLNRNIILLKEYQKAVDVSSIVSITDTKGVIKYVNEKFCEISKYSQEELIGKSHNIVRHPNMPKEAFKNLWDTIQSKKVWSGVVKNRKKDGGTYIVNATIVPIIDENSKIVEYIGLRQDITDLIRTTKLADDYKRAVDSSNIVSITDTKGVIKYVNEKFCEITGYSKEELIGQPHNIVRHPDMPKEAFANLWKTIQAKKIWQGVVKNRKKDGDYYTVDATILPITDEDDNIIEYIGLRHDLTDFMKQKEREKELLKDTLESIKKATQVSIETVIESIPLPTIMIEQDNSIISFNSEFLDIFDMQLDSEVISKLKAKNLNLNDVFKRESGYLHSDDMFDWKENVIGDYTLDQAKIKTELEEFTFIVKLGEFKLEDRTLYTVCFKNRDENDSGEF